MRQSLKEARGIGFVFRVVDGDTIYAFWSGESVKIRLDGIDAPEISHPREMPGYYGEEAREAVVKLVLGKHVWMETSGVRDVYGRLIAVVFLENGVMLNEWLVRHGFAREMSDVQQPCKYRDCFLLAEQEAKEKLQGMWEFLLTGRY